MMSREEFDRLLEAEKRRLRQRHREAIASGEREVRPAAMGNRAAPVPPAVTRGPGLTDSELLATAQRNSADARARREAMREPPSGGWSS